MSENIKLELDPSVPTLDLEALPQAAPISAPIDTVALKENAEVVSAHYMDDVNLTEEEQKMVDDFAEQIDLTSRLIFVKKMHKTYPGTGAVCTASAVKIKGTIPNRIVKNAEELKLVRIGHPAGVIEVEVDADYSNGIGKITRAAIDRTARKIMDGTVYVTD